MPKCKPCLGTEIKGAILETFPGLGELLEEIPSCKRDTDLELCLNEPRESRSGKKKRVPSKYNIFIGNCIKQDKSMKQCAAEYKKGA